jgi:hypothetical protein
VAIFTPCPLSPEKELLGTRWMKNWVGPRVGLDAIRKRKISALSGNRTLIV